MQELVRPVRVRVRPEHACDEELRLRKFLAEHRHERNGAAFAHPHRRLAIVLLRRPLDRALEPARGRRRVPAGRRLAVFVAHVGAVRRIALQ